MFVSILSIHSVPSSSIACPTYVLLCRDPTAEAPDDYEEGEREGQGACPGQRIIPCRGYPLVKAPSRHQPSQTLDASRSILTIPSSPPASRLTLTVPPRHTSNLSLRPTPTESTRSKYPPPSHQSGQGYPKKTPPEVLTPEHAQAPPPPLPTPLHNLEEVPPAPPTLDIHTTSTV